MLVAPLQPAPSASSAASLIQAHPVKTERHDTARLEHHTNTGSRAVQVYREHAHGLYVSRAFVGHPRIRHWQAHLLPALGVQLCRYSFHGIREHDYYLDIATISRRGPVWTVRDHYLDLIVHEGLGAEIVDGDELEAAHAAGYVSGEERERAVRAAHRVWQGLRVSGFSVSGWLREQGLDLGWAAGPSLR